VKGCPFYPVSENGSIPVQKARICRYFPDSFFVRGRDKRDILYLLICTASKLKRRRVVQTVSHNQILSVYCRLHVSAIIMRVYSILCIWSPKYFIEMTKTIMALMLIMIITLLLSLLLQLLSAVRQHIDNRTCEDEASQIYIEPSSSTIIWKLFASYYWQKATQRAWRKLYCTSPQGTSESEKR
jgi:hypothetical protein